MNARFVCVLFAILLFVAAPLAAQKQKKESAKPGVKKASPPSRSGAVSNVEVVGLTIGKPLPNKEGFGGFGMFGVQPGTRLIVSVSDPARQIVDLDEKASKIAAFTDDKGTDLLKKEEPKKSGFGGGFSIGFGTMSANVSEDKHACTVEVRGENRPAAGAVKIRLRGDLVFKCGEGEKIDEAKDLSLAKGTTFSGGPLEFKIDEVSASGGFGDSKMTVTLETEGEFEVVKQIAFFGADGNEIKSQRMSSFSSGFGAKTTHQIQYGLAEKVKQATVKVTYFQKLESVTVPVDVTVGVGF